VQNSTYFRNEKQIYKVKKTKKIQQCVHEK